MFPQERPTQFFYAVKFGMCSFQAVRQPAASLGCSGSWSTWESIKEHHQIKVLYATDSAEGNQKGKSKREQKWRKEFLSRQSFLDMYLVNQAFSHQDTHNTISLVSNHS